MATIVPEGSPARVNAGAMTSPPAREGFDVSDSTATPPTPRRVQLSRAKGTRQVPPGAIRIDRFAPWGNPFTIGKTITGCRLYDSGTFNLVIPDAHTAVRYFELWLVGAIVIPGKTPPTLEQIRAELGGHDLACWCRLDAPWCHGNSLLTVANP